MKTLLLGGPGSGKTSRILAMVRDHLRQGDSRFRVVVPSATMAKHLLHQLAREGAAPDPRCFTTLAGLLAELMPATRAASSSDIELLISRVLAGKCPEYFRPLMGSRGLARALAGAVEDLDGAGCGSLEWDALRSLGVATGPFAAALGEIYAGLEVALRPAGLLTRGSHIAAAAALAREGEVPAWGAIYWDGFFSLTPREVAVVTALATRADCVVSLPEWPGASPAVELLRAAGFQQQRCQLVRHAPAMTLAEAAHVEGEVEDIARRILLEHSNGRAWRDIGVVLRSNGEHAQLLRLAFARLGIPVRTYFAEKLSASPAYALVGGIVDALLSEWDHALLLPALRSTAGIAGSAAAIDRFDFLVREAMPARGLDQLKSMARDLPGAESLLEMLIRLSELDSWRLERLPPAEWARRLGGLAEFAASPVPEGVLSAETVDTWRRRAAALRDFAAGLNAFVELTPLEPSLLAAFWAEARHFLESQQLRPGAPSRDAVNLMDVYEARQWELPVVFLAGLVEGEFPRAARPDSMLDEGLRFRLRVQGFPVKSRAEQDAEEEFLFRFALTRATERLTLSWPRLNAKGDPLLRSFAVDSVQPGIPVESAQGFTVEPHFPAPPLPQPSIGAEVLQADLANRHAVLHPTSIEKFLQCPFKFFGGVTLKLAGASEDAAERLDARLEGHIFHRVVEAWHREGGDILSHLGVIWPRELRKKRISEGYRSVVLRERIGRALLAYQEDPKLHAGWKVLLEEPVKLELGGFVVEGRLDRVDVSAASDASLFELKFTAQSGFDKRSKKIKEGVLVQGGLYLAALAAQGLKPQSFYLGGFKEKANWKSWESSDEVAELVSSARQGAGRTHEQLLLGVIRPQPFDTDECDFCDFLDACRIQSAELALGAGG